MKRWYVILLMLLLVIPVAAQQRTGNIYGKILDAERNPLPGVTVTLSGPQIAPLTTVTSAVGLYRFVSLSPGNEYVVKAELQGFKTVSQGNIIVTVGGNSEVNLIMEVGKLEEQVTVTATTPIVDTKKTVVGAMVDKETMQSLPTARDPWTVMQLAPSIMLDRENVGGNESGQQSGFIGKGDVSSSSNVAGQGGRESGNQGANNIWAIDGIDITDPAALGGSALYYDFDMFEELNITTGGAADVSIQTGGVALNMVTRRGGNRMSLAGRFYLTDNFFQSSNITDALRNEGVINTNTINSIKDYGFNAGGPLVKDKVWWWGAYGVQDISVNTIVGAKDTTLLGNYNFKLNAQLLANNRFEALVTSGAKEKIGRDSSVARPEGNHQIGKYHWGSPIVKLQDEHVFGNNLYVSLKYSFNDAGFGWRPVPDEGVIYPIVYDQSQATYVPYTTGMNHSWGSYYVGRPRNNYQITGSYFNDTFLGMSHEIKVGAEYSNKKQTYHTGNYQGYDITRNYNTLNLDSNADGTRTLADMAGWQRVVMYRSNEGASITNQYAAYFQDTITKGNFTVSLGLRYDLQVPSSGAYSRSAIYPGETAWDTVFDPATSAVLQSVLPDTSVEATKGENKLLDGSLHAYSWSTWSPRIGLTWDIFGTGKTVAKLALSQYGDVMGVGWFAISPVGTGGGLRYWWYDTNADRKMQLTEMYWMYSTLNPVANPAAPGLPYRYVPYQVFTSDGSLTAAAEAMLDGGYDSDAYYAGQYYSFDYLHPDQAPDYTKQYDYFANRGAQSSARTREILLTLEHELLPDFSVALNATYRRYDKFDYFMDYYPEEHKADEYPDYTGPAIIDPTTPPAGGWYVEAGTIPDTITITYPVNSDESPVYPWIGGGDIVFSTGDAAGRPFYLRGPDWPTTSTNYDLCVKSDAYNTYMGLDIVLNKRLSNKWMMNASFTLQQQKMHWGSYYFDPTNKWAFDGQTYGDWGGGASGKVAVLMYTPWMAKLSGLYQLPWGFDISGTLNARQGWKIPNYFTINVEDAPNYAADHDSQIYTQNYTKESLPTFCNVTLRLEKKINISTGRLFLMADVFNLFNAATPNRSYDANYGTAYYDMEGAQYASSYNSNNHRLNEILNPRIWRFGARFEF
jgi:hypothetical protein